MKHSQTKELSAGTPGCTTNRESDTPWSQTAWIFTRGRMRFTVSLEDWTNLFLGNAHLDWSIPSLDNAWCRDDFNIQCISIRYQKETTSQWHWTEKGQAAQWKASGALSSSSGFWPSRTWTWSYFESIWLLKAICLWMKSCWGLQKLFELSVSPDRIKVSFVLSGHLILWLRILRCFYWHDD